MCVGACGRQEDSRETRPVQEEGPLDHFILRGRGRKSSSSRSTDNKETSESVVRRMEHKQVIAIRFGKRKGQGFGPYWCLGYILSGL